MPHIAQTLPAVQGVVVHTSGSVDMAVLQGQGRAQGVLYPLQTLKKNIDINFDSVPLLIEATTPIALKQLHVLAQKISQNVQQISSVQRLQLHLAAVFACNFVNHLWAIADGLLQKEQLDPKILHGLMHQTLHNATNASPAQAQTGPAFRHDTKIIAKHLERLQHQPDIQQIYQILSENIIKMYPKN
jgi:predicted short-subunit dehydrogenase-like oxidoreductase (DUF2520 family)